MKQHYETNKERFTPAGFSASNLRGILLPFPTPFSGVGDVDAPALGSNIEKWNETSIVGYVALGSTGERVHLDEREYIRVIEAARACVPEQLAFIVGAGQQSVRGSVDEVRRAALAGADAVLVITPHFYRGAMTQSALVDYYRMVADDSPVPVLLYSMPELTGIALAAETVARLSEHGNIVGIKDSSGDVINFAEMLRVVPDDFAVLTGNGALLYAALSAGGRGAILAVGCVAPRLAVAIYDAVEAGDHKRARELQRRLTPLARAVTVRYGIGGLKAALDMIGYKGGAVRAPLAAASEEARREIARLIREANFVEEQMSGETGYDLAGATKE